jgi:cell division protein FtsQ
VARFLAIGVGLLFLAAGVYAAARTTSAFAVDRIEVAGAPPKVRHQVLHATAPLRSSSLLALDGGKLERTLAALPGVVKASYDRAFPHTLRLVVVPEAPVAVVRQGAKAWLLSARGRVVQPVDPRARRALTRVWIPRTTRVTVGGFLPANHAGAVARSLALAAQFPARIAVAKLKRDGLLFRLRSGLELRLGEPNDIRLKLAIARVALPKLPGGTLYFDVSVPERPVAGNSQLSGRD